MTHLVGLCKIRNTSAKNYPASDTAPLCPEGRDVESVSPASCAS